MEEIWKPAIYIDRYGNRTYFDNCEVSNNNRYKIYNYNKTGKTVIRDFSNRKEKYYQIELKGRTMAFHRLVISSFCPKSNTYECVNHRDCNTHNNNPLNLEWCSSYYNNTYADRLLKSGKKHKGILNRSSSKRVIQYDLNDNYINTYPSTMEVERQLFIKSQCISACCKGRQQTAGGFKWKYADS